MGKMKNGEALIGRAQFTERLCATVVRIHWLLVVVALLPLVFQFLTGIVALGSVLYLMFLLLFVIASLGALLLNEGFRALFHSHGLDAMQAFTDQIIGFYKVVMPLLFLLSLLLFSLNLFVSLRCGSGNKVRGKIAAGSICLALTVLALILFYAWMLRGNAS